MREIKFRVWERDTDEKQTPIEMRYCQDFKECASVDENYGNLSVWMQFTGLKDKNGKDIYESDVLKIDNSISVVQFSEINLNKDDYGLFERALCWNEKHKDCEIPLISNKEKAYGTLCTECEVIGNIYENPELL